MAFRFSIVLALLACASSFEVMKLNKDFLTSVQSIKDLASGVTFSRTVNSLTGATGNITISSGCTSKDQYGSNDCTLVWGQTYNITIDGALKADLQAGTKVNVDLKIDGIIPFSTSCLVCGANCTIDIPIVKKKVTFATPPCPIKAASILKTISAALPAKSPVPVSTKIAGSITVTDSTGAKIADISISAALSP